MADTPQRGRFARVLMEGVDRAFLGNRGFNYNTGLWDRRGAIQGGIQSGLGRINPILGVGARLWFNHQNNQRNPSQATLTPAQNIGFTPNWGLSGPQGFQGQVQPGPQADPASLFGSPQSQPPPNLSNPYTNWQGNRQQNPVMGMGGLTGQAASMGGARGAHSQGGFTGEAARALLQSMQRGPQYIYTGGGGPIRS